MKLGDVDRVVAAIDEIRRTEHWRDPDRPDGRAVPVTRGRVPVEIVRAQARLRTAHWRTRMDRRKRPSLEQVGVALAVAFAGHPQFTDIYSLEGTILERAMTDLQARGFSPREAQDVLRKLRRRLVDPGDRQNEESKSCRADGVG
jgi:hypothetical protein